MFTTNPQTANDHDMQLSCAHQLTLFGPKPIPIIDDADGQLYVYGQEYGPMRLVRARSWEDAYEMVIDDLPTIALDEMEEAYVDMDDDQSELEEGYQYQSNFSGTGIVNTGYHEWLHELTPADSIVPIFTPW